MNIDFKEIRKAMDEFASKLSGEISEDEVERIMRERALVLAERDEKRSRANSNDEILHHIIAVRRAQSRFGLPITAVQELREVIVTRLPRGTEYVQGLYQLRGQVGCVVDLQPYFGPPEPLPEDCRITVAIIQGESGSLALRIDEILGPRQVTRSECDEQLRERTRDFVTDVTRDLLALIDIERLFARAEIELDAAA